MPHSPEAELRLYDRLLTDQNPDAWGKDFKQALNPIWLRHAMPDEKFQFERHGYFVADGVDHSATRPVFNRVVTLNDSWGR